MEWLFLSPHLDDAVLSCGGMIYDRVQAGDRATILTVCAGDPADTPLSPFALSLHARWGNQADIVKVRRREDLAACQVVGAAAVQLDFPDCIYRRNPLTGGALVSTNDDLFQPLPEFEFTLSERIAEKVSAYIPAAGRVVCPLTLGGHIDHQLTRRAAERLGLSLLYYADYPYLVLNRLDLKEHILPGWQERRFPVSPAGRTAWIKAVAQHESQISTFWGGIDEMSQAVTAYWSSGGGSALWGPE